MLVERQFGLEQVEAQRFIVAQALPLDVGENRRGTFDLAFLSPGFGSLQAVAVGVAGRLIRQRQVGLRGLDELALPGQRIGALRRGDFSR